MGAAEVRTGPRGGVNGEKVLSDEKILHTEVAEQQEDMFDLLL